MKEGSDCEWHSENLSEERGVLGKPLFEMCWFHMGITCRGGGDGAQSFARMVWGTFFPRLPV